MSNGEELSAFHTAAGGTGVLPTQEDISEARSEASAAVESTSCRAQLDGVQEVFAQVR